MRSFLLLIPMLLLFACKKDKNDHPVFSGRYDGVTYTLQNDLKVDIQEMQLSFHGGDKFDFTLRVPTTDNELKFDGKKYYTRGADSIYFHGIELTSSQLVQGYRYTVQGDSLIMIRQGGPTFSRQIRLRRAY